MFKIIGVFPNVEAEQRRFARAQRRVLIWSRLNLQRVAIQNQPSPAAAELSERDLGKFFLERVETVEAGVNRFRQLTSRFAAAVFFHHLPEDRMVVMTAAVIADGGADAFRNG